MILDTMKNMGQDLEERLDRRFNERFEEIYTHLGVLIEDAEARFFAAPETLSPSKPINLKAMIDALENLKKESLLEASPYPPESPLCKGGTS